MMGRGRYQPRAGASILASLFLLSACNIPVSGVSTAELNAGIRGAFADNGCVIKGLSKKDGEAAFENALAKRLGVDVSQVSDRQGDIFMRGDDIVDEMIRAGEIKVVNEPPSATLIGCTPSVN